MIFLPHIILIGFNLVNSRVDAYRILKHKYIAHGINFGAYLVIAILCIWLFQMNLARSILFIFSALFNRQITFDIPLNLRRKLKWDHVSQARPPAAFWDRFEIRVFGYNGRLPVLVYSCLWIIFLTPYFIL